MDKRQDILDFLRGYLILLMITSHISIIFYHAYNRTAIHSFLMNIETGIEGFLILAGFMIGLLLYPKFQNEPAKVSFKLLKRVLQIVIVQYIMLITVLFPEQYFINHIPDFGEFAIRSFLFMNQIGPFHILPTFIPVFIIAPVILYMFHKNLDFLVVIISLGLFCVGLFNPYIVRYGDNAIFPFNLYQIYFVIGCFWGKYIHKAGSVIPDNINRLFLYSFIAFFIVIFLKHGHHVFHSLLELRLNHGISFSKFPLSLSGFIHQVVLMFFIYCLTAVSWKRMTSSHYVIPFVNMLGRNAMMIFIIHVYTDAAIRIVTRCTLNEMYTWISSVTTSCLIILAVYLKENRKNRLVTKVSASQQIDLKNRQNA